MSLTVNGESALELGHNARPRHRPGEARVIPYHADDERNVDFGENVDWCADDGHTKIIMIAGAIHTNG